MEILVSIILLVIIVFVFMVPLTLILSSENIQEKYGIDIFWGVICYVIIWGFAIFKITEVNELRDYKALSYVLAADTNVSIKKIPKEYQKTYIKIKADLAREFTEQKLEKQIENNKTN